MGGMYTRWRTSQCSTPVNAPWHPCHRARLQDLVTPGRPHVGRGLLPLLSRLLRQTKTLQSGTLRRLCRHPLVQGVEGLLPMVGTPCQVPPGYLQAHGTPLSGRAYALKMCPRHPTGRSAPARHTVLCRENQQVPYGTTRRAGPPGSPPLPDEQPPPPHRACRFVAGQRADEVQLVELWLGAPVLRQQVTFQLPPWGAGEGEFG